MTKEHEITVTIESGRGTQQFIFPMQTKVQEAANQAAVALGYPAGGKYALFRFSTKEELEGERTLVSYKIEDGEVLALSETGTGV